MPIDLGETMQTTDAYDIHLPAGYVVDELPDPVKLDLGFATYQSASEVKDGTLHYTRTLTVRQVTLPASRYAEVQKLAGVIQADEDSRAVLKSNSQCRSHGKSSYEPQPAPSPHQPYRNGLHPRLHGARPVDATHRRRTSHDLQPEVPGAPAVYLSREEITDDALHMWSRYVRLKILTEKGKEFANVELVQYEAALNQSGYTVENIEGRTIHPDGTIIPFTGKPHEKLVEKDQSFTATAKVLHACPTSRWAALSSIATSFGMTMATTDLRAGMFNRISTRARATTSGGPRTSN